MQEDIGGKPVPLNSTSKAYEPCYIGKGLIVGNDIVIGAMCHIGRSVEIGNGTRIQGSTYISDCTKIESNVFIGPNSTILNDKYPPSGNKDKWSSVTIREKAIIGGGTTILPGVTIGVNAVLGAGSVLTKSIPDGEVWKGNPASFHMQRNEYEERRG
jgi:UDP-2-acetamido-3-amino-2,3-dideoxy-glucuronate N-acetyltransferase